MSARILATIQLIRPLNLVLSLTGVGVGAVLAAGWDAFSAPHVTSVITAMISAAAIASAANAVNDARDIDIDRINRPDRPLPSGRISDGVALVTWLSGAALGVGLSLLLTPVHIAIAVLAVLAVLAYSYRLKQFGLIGNIVVGLVVSSTLIYGALAAGRVGAAWVGCVAAFLMTLAREIAKDLEDVEGDTVGNVRSLPILFGAAVTRRIVVVLVAITIALAPLPYTHLGFSGVYLFGVATTSVILLSAIWTLVRSVDETSGQARTTTMLKSAMITGMAALLFA